MELEDKKYLILEYIKLGLSLNKAYLLTTCTREEQENLEQDAEFQQQVKIRRILKEEELLKLHDEALKAAAKRGEAKGIQWRLEKLDPEEYDKRPVKQIQADITTSSVLELGEQTREDIAKELLAVLKGDLK